MGTFKVSRNFSPILNAKQKLNENCPFIAPPSPPQNLRAPDVTSRSVTLDWEVPARNGGSEITGRVVWEAFYT